jgi:MFS superfamily sulfate permease-like transporter
MRITRDIFQISALVIMGLIVYVWLFIEESEKTIPTVVLVSLFILLSVEYIREGLSQKKP